MKISEAGLIPSLQRAWNCFRNISVCILTLQCRIRAMELHSTLKGSITNMNSPYPSHSFCPFGLYDTLFTSHLVKYHHGLRTPIHPKSITATLFFKNHNPITLCNHRVHILHNYPLSIGLWTL